MLSIEITLMHIIWIKYKIIKNDFLKGTNLFTQNIFNNYLLEVIWNMISPYPWFYNSKFQSISNGEKMMVYSNTPLLVFMMFSRTYHFAKILLNQSYYMTSRADRIGKFFGHDHGYPYALKWELKKRSFFIVLLSFSYFWAVGGLLLRWSELQVQEYFESPTDKFTFNSSCWIWFVTMATVGYGELTPITYTGKVIAVWLSFIGVGLTSLMVVSTLRIFDMSDSEKTSFMLIKLVNLRQRLKTVTAQVITRIFKWK